MAYSRIWDDYPDTYRASEIRTLANWIAVGESGSVVGLPGSGRSNLLGFLCHRPDVLQTYFSSHTNPIALIPVDLNNLPGSDMSTLYRTILHAFYWVRDRFAPDIQQTIADLYLENRGAQDSFLAQRVLYDVILLFQERQIQVVLVLNRFDRFCQTATPHMINTLRGLRDNFKDTLCFLVGMLQEAVYLPDPATVGDMYELLDLHVCWVGAMTDSDARQMLDRLFRATSKRPNELETATMLSLSGRFPVLLKAVTHWWRTSSHRSVAAEFWVEALLNEKGIQYRLERIWAGLTQEEQQTLSEVQKLQTQVEKQVGEAVHIDCIPDKLKNSFDKLANQQEYALIRLESKGLCDCAGSYWRITGKLLAAYVAKIEGRVRGRIWIDEKAKTIFQYKTPIEELTALQYKILQFLIKNPHIKHTRDDIIDYAWPEEDQREGITPNALQVQITSIRKKIEPRPAQPHYLITWHGRPGGYQFFPEGKPR